MATINHDVNDVLTFVRVVENGSFSAAARELGVPTSSVSRRVARLEDDLGVQLMQRTTRRLNLTDAGRILFEYGAQISSDLVEAERSVASLQAKPQGRLRVSMPVGSGVLCRTVVEFAAAYPEVTVDVDLTDRRVDLVEEGIDVALRAGVLVDSSLIAHKLIDTRLRLFASPDYLARRKAPRRVADLATHDCVAFVPLAGGCTWTFRDGDKTVRFAFEPRLLTNGIAMARDAALAGLGIALLPDLGMVEDVEAGRVVPVLPDVAAPGGALSVVYPSRRHLAPKVRVFVDYMREHLPSCLKALGKGGACESLRDSRQAPSRRATKSKARTKR